MTAVKWLIQKALKMLLLLYHKIDGSVYAIHLGTRNDYYDFTIHINSYKDGEQEDDHLYEQQSDYRDHCITFEPTYNQEDGSM